MSKVRVGVIGAGSWAIASHLPNLAKHDDLEFVGISRKGEEILHKIKDRYGFQIASEDYRDVLNAGVDICVIGSPTGLHHEHAKAAMESGAHVMCEKPVTIEPTDAWDLDSTAKKLNRKLIIAFGWNYLPMMREAKALMEKFGIGELEHLTLHMSSATRELLSNTGAYPDATPESLPEQRTWTDPKLSGGGYGQAQLTHGLGMGLWLTGARVESGFALMSAPMNAPVEMHDAIAYRFENGAIGAVSGGSAHAPAHKGYHAHELRAIGSDGQLLLDLERAAVWLYYKGENIRLELGDDDGYYNCQGPIDALVSAGRGIDFINYSPGELGARSVEALDVAYRSAASGKLEHRR
jgi:predicted dehydrogenase